jgi:hypothetical protein
MINELGRGSFQEAGIEIFENLGRLISWKSEVVELIQSSPPLKLISFSSTPSL